MSSFIFFHYHFMKRAFLLLVVVLCMSDVKAQTPEDSVKQLVFELFAAMKNSDSNRLKKCFTDSAFLQVVTTDSAGKTTIRTVHSKKFINQISALKKGSADEHATIDVVKVDREIAMVWAPYQFYFNQKFSHSGVDCFQMVRIAGIWKIQYLLYNR